MSRGPGPCLRGMGLCGGVDRGAQATVPGLLSVRLSGSEGAVWARGRGAEGKGMAQGRGTDRVEKQRRWGCVWNAEWDAEGVWCAWRVGAQGDERVRNVVYVVLALAAGAADTGPGGGGVP